MEMDMLNDTANEMVPSVVDYLRRLQPEHRLDLAVERIDQLESERREEHAAHLVTMAAYAKLADVVRLYLADHNRNARALVEFYLAKAPK